MTKLPFRTESPPTRKPKRRSSVQLRLDMLEDRCVPNAAGSVPGIVDILWQGQQTKAYAGQWIAQFENITGTVSEQITTIQKQLNASGQPFIATQHLGRDGLVLVQTAPDLAFEAVQTILDRSSNLDFVDPNFAVTLSSIPNDTQFGELWGMHNTGQTIRGFPGTADADIDAPEAWDIATGTGSAVVAVLDTGIDITHPDLTDNIYINPGEIPGNNIDDDGNSFVDDMNGWNFFNNSPHQNLGIQVHGTHVAGTIGAEGNNSLGVTGVAHNVKIMPIQIFGPYEEFAGIANVVAGMNYVLKMKTRLNYSTNIVATNNSWGSSNAPFETALSNAISAHCDAANGGILFVAAAGNVSRNIDVNPHYPASFTQSNVISVAATTNTDARRATSNWGKISVDLGAPGQDILSTMPGSTYGYLSGTSMAAPHVAGAAALLKMASPNMSAVQIKAAILNTVDPIFALRTNGPTPVLTGGRLNIHNALRSLPPHVIDTSVEPSEVLPFGVVQTTYIVTFSEAMDADILTPDEFTLHGTFRQSAGVNYTPSSFSFDTPTTLKLVYDNLPDDSYTLTIVADYFLNAVGMRLDGEFSGSFPSGDGEAGEDFVIGFYLDLKTEAIPTPLAAVRPLGSLIYAAPPLDRTIAFVGDTDKFTLNVDPNQTITIIVTPLTIDPGGAPGLVPQVELLDPSNNSLGKRIGVLQTRATRDSGTYTVVVRNVGPLQGLYSVQVILNSAIEDVDDGEFIGDDDPNNSFDTAQNINGSFITLVSTPTKVLPIRPSVRRGAVLGGIFKANTEDWYRFTLNAGDRVTVAVTTSNDEPLTVSVRDPDGTILNLIPYTGATNLDTVIRNFRVPSTGAYRVRLDGFSVGGLSYSLVITQNGAFDTENNDSVAMAQDVTGTQGVLGHVGGAGSTSTLEDWYKVRLGPGQTSVTVETRTPADGPGQFVNTLNPHIQFYDSNNALFPSVPLLDGRNERILAVGLTPGATYYVRVTAEGGTAGEYVASIEASPFSSPRPPALSRSTAGDFGGTKAPPALGQAAWTDGVFHGFDLRLTRTEDTPWREFTERPVAPLDLVAGARKDAEFDWRDTEFSDGRPFAVRGQDHLDALFALSLFTPEDETECV